MNILCIETSASLCSVALLKGDQQYYCDGDKPMAHAEILTDLMDTCMRQAGLEMKELDAIALSGGPGSYTGLRIGCSTAKGLCYGLKIPLIVIDTLQITAAAAIIKSGKAACYWAMTDARRMEVYHALFNTELEQITDTKSGIITDSDFTPEIVIGKTVVLCGDGAAKAAPVLQLEDAEVVANASAMCESARSAYLRKDFADLAYYEPFYLKQANITVSKS